MMLRSDPAPGPSRRHRSAAVLGLPQGASAAQVIELLCGDDRLALVALVLEPPGIARNGREGFLHHLDRLIERCRRLGFDPSAIDQLDHSIREADGQVARSLTRILRHLLEGSPVLLIRRPGTDTAPSILPDGFTAAIGEMLGVTVELLHSIEEVFTAPFERPPPVGILRDSDQALLEVLTAPDDQLEASWNSWLDSASLDDQHGIEAVASVLQERLHGIGVADHETGRLTGLRRRAWFANTLMKNDLAATIRLLDEIDIDPVLTGDILDALESEQSDGVRRIRTAGIIVGVDEAQRALDQLTARYEPVSPWVPAGPMSWSLQSRLRLQLDVVRMLNLDWRWLPERSAERVPLTSDGIDRLEMDGTPVRGLSPSYRLVELCSSSANRIPGSALATFMHATELIDRHHLRIDWEWVWSAVDRLDLVDHARVMLAQMPERVRELAPILQTRLNPEPMSQPDADPT